MKHRSWQADAGETVIARYEYDALNRRTKEFVNADTDDDFDSFRHFYYTFGWQLLETRLATSENDGPETLQPEYQHIWSVRYIDAAVLRDKNTDDDDLCDDQRLYYLNDANMNVTALLDTDGTVLERYAYDPYGNVKVYSDDWSTEVAWAASKKNNIRFCGYYFDNETGLYNLRTRYYHPYFGCMITRDGDYYDGMSLYEYARGAPTTRKDPSGLVTQMFACKCMHIIVHEWFYRVSVTVMVGEIWGDIECVGRGVPPTVISGGMSLSNMPCCLTACWLGLKHSTGSTINLRAAGSAMQGCMQSGVRVYAGLLLYAPCITCTVL